MSEMEKTDIAKYNKQYYTAVIRLSTFWGSCVTVLYAVFTFLRATTPAIHYLMQAAICAVGVLLILLGLNWALRLIPDKLNIVGWVFYPVLFVLIVSLFILNVNWGFF